MKKILIVDDSNVMRQMLRTELSKKNYQVIEAQNGLEALEIATKERPDMIISDINMPVMDGWEFCWKLRKDPVLGKTPFIFLSANNEVSDRVRGIQLGADDYIIKPFSPEELIARVQNLFQRYQKPKEVPSRSLTGNLAKMGLPNLLQFLNMNRQTGILEIQHEEELGYIYIVEGDIVNAKVGGIEGKKALFRILSWKKGFFSFEEGEVQVEPLLRENTLKLIMNGLKQVDELERMEEKLPPRHGILHMEEGLLEDEDFDETIRDFFRLVHREKEVGKVLDKSPLTDLQVYQIIDLMLQEGLFRLEVPKG